MAKSKTLFPSDFVIDRINDVNNKYLASILPLGSTPKLKETVYITEQEDILQMGFVVMFKGDTRSLHVHPSRKRERNLQEILLILQGEVDLLLSDNSSGGTILRRRLSKNDLVHIAGGTHGLEAFTDSLLLIIKQSEGRISEKKYT